MIEPNYDEPENSYHNQVAFGFEAPYDNEDKYINQFSKEFVSNRMSGGKITGGLLQAILMSKSRKMV